MCRSAGIGPMACTLGKSSTIELHLQHLLSILLPSPPYLSPSYGHGSLQTVQGAAKLATDTGRVYDQKIILEK